MGGLLDFGVLLNLPPLPNKSYHSGKQEMLVGLSLVAAPAVGVLL